mmetsp:Transcript_8447/g.17589  ORF Transcript_8447/g.17589 Transcript_8447/m.17589 type:complete len:335 (+) Transcript_8447:652-1656(+)
MERRQPRTNDANQFLVALLDDLQAAPQHDGCLRCACHHGRKRHRKRQHRRRGRCLPHCRPARIGGLREGIQEPHSHGRWVWIHRSQSLQGFKIVLDDDRQLLALQVPQAYRCHLQLHVSGMHRRIAFVPGEARMVPHLLSHFHEIHHRRIRGRTRSGTTPVPGGTRSPLLQIGRLLVVERWTPRGTRGRSPRKGRADQRGRRCRRRLGLHLRKRPVLQGSEHRKGKEIVRHVDRHHRGRVADPETNHQPVPNAQGHWCRDTRHGEARRTEANERNGTTGHVRRGRGGHGQGHRAGRGGRSRRCPGGGSNHRDARGQDKTRGEILQETTGRYGCR